MSLENLYVCGGVRVCTCWWMSNKSMEKPAQSSWVICIRSHSIKWRHIILVLISLNQRPRFLLILFDAQFALSWLLFLPSAEHSWGILKTFLLSHLTRLSFHSRVINNHSTPTLGQAVLGAAVPPLFLSVRAFCHCTAPFYFLHGFSKTQINQ